MEADSRMPTDDFTFTDGSSWGLDGFDFEEQGGKGVLDGARLPTVHGLSGLPDGFMDPEPDPDDLPHGVLADEDAGFDLQAMLVEGSRWDDKALHGKTKALTDLNWLDPTQEQDEDRLPVNPVDKGLEELADAWGSGMSTNGLRLVPGKTDKEIADWEASFRKGPKSGLPDGDPVAKKARAVRIQHVLDHAARQSAYGLPIDQILREAAGGLDGEAKKHLAAMQAVVDGHGLAGRVYVEARHFPGLMTGKWDPAIRSRCATAKWLVVPDGHPLAKQAGHLGKLVVTESKGVPWRAAYRHYKGLASALGIRVAQDMPGDVAGIKVALKSLLAMPAPPATPAANHQPVHTPPADRVSLSTASKVLAGIQAPVAPRAKDAIREDRLRQAARTQITRWHAAGLLSDGDRDRLILSGAPVKAVVTAALQIVRSSGRSATYAGQGAHLPKVAVASRTEALASLQAAELAAQQVQTDIQVSARGKLEAKLGALVKAGLLESRQRDVILQANRSAEASIKLAMDCLAHRSVQRAHLPTTASRTARYVGQGAGTKAPRIAMDLDAAVQTLNAIGDPHADFPAKMAERDRRMAVAHVDALASAGLLSSKEAERLKDLNVGLADTLAGAAVCVARRQAAPAPVIAGTVPVAKYSGEGEGAQPTGQSMDPARAWAILAKSAADVRVSSLEVRALLGWVRRAMSEGLVGNELDEILSVRFAKPVLAAAATKLAEVRSAHEGLAGLVYVDASAYASKTGTTGCDEGALKHRANQLKHVLAMQRCSGCAFANELPDGRTVCQKYAKQLVDAPPVKNPARWQASAIRQANVSDAEQTASLFAPAWSDDYDLGGSGEMDSIDLIELSPSAEELGEVLYGGMEVGF